MKTTLTNSMILLLVASGTALGAYIGMSALNLAPLETLFLCFVAVIIAIQLIPAVMLFTGMFKVLFARTEKRSEME